MRMFTLFMPCALVLSSSPSQPQTPKPLAFDVAAIHLSSPQTTRQSSNVPLGPGSVYTPTHGLFSTRNFTLLDYIAFAYRMTDAQLQAFHAQAPTWVSETHYDIEGRTDQPDLTKDQLRLMTRTLLADRFHLAVHYEARQKPVYNLQLLKAPTTGPRLLPHATASHCPSTLPAATTATTTKPPSETVAGGFPVTCGGILRLPPELPGNVTIGGRNVTLVLLASSLPGWGNLGRPVIDTTTLPGTYDFVLTYLYQPGSEAIPENLEGDTFQQALAKQLGLKLESAKADVQLLILDHIDHVTPN